MVVGAIQLESGEDLGSIIILQMGKWNVWESTAFFQG